MAIDKNPQVGRIIMRESRLYDGYFAKGGRITKISGRRIYFESWWHEDMTIEYTVNFAAVCDTEEEARMLLDFGQAKMEEVRQLRNRQAEEAAALFTTEAPNA